MVTFGCWWTVLALLGLSGFIAAVAIGGLFGLQDLEEGLLGWPPILGAAFGVSNIAPAMAVMAWGSLRASALPRYGTTAMFVAAPMIPLSAFLGGNVHPAGFIVAVVFFAVAWIAIGSA